jgi:hypothetical protein
MFRLGTIDAQRWSSGQALPGLHSSEFWPEVDTTIRTGVEAMSAAALGLLGNR